MTPTLVRHAGGIVQLPGAGAPRGQATATTANTLKDCLPPFPQAAGVAPSRGYRLGRCEPRLGLDTDHRTIPNEDGWIGTAVYLDKGCYGGQEAVNGTCAGTSSCHHGLGPIALATVKPNVSLGADGIPAAQEVVVDPEVGLHLRPAL